MLLHTIVTNAPTVAEALLETDAMDEPVLVYVLTVRRPDAADLEANPDVAKVAKLAGPVPNGEGARAVATLLEKMAGSVRRAADELDADGADQ